MRKERRETLINTGHRKERKNELIDKRKKQRKTVKLQEDM